jgi:hypothetical protein
MTRRWVSVVWWSGVLVLAVLLGCLFAWLITANAGQDEQLRELVEQQAEDREVADLGACERGNVLRLTIIQLVEQLVAQSSNPESAANQRTIGAVHERLALVDCEAQSVP